METFLEVAKNEEERKRVLEEFKKENNIRGDVMNNEKTRKAFAEYFSKYILNKSRQLKDERTDLTG